MHTDFKYNTFNFVFIIIQAKFKSVRFIAYQTLSFVNHQLMKYKRRSYMKMLL